MIYYNSLSLKIRCWGCFVTVQFKAKNGISCYLQTILYFLVEKENLEILYNMSSFCTFYRSNKKEAPSTQHQWVLAADYFLCPHTVTLIMAWHFRCQSETFYMQQSWLSRPLSSWIRLVRLRALKQAGLSVISQPFISCLRRISNHLLNNPLGELLGDILKKTAYIMVVIALQGCAAAATNKGVLPALSSAVWMF